MAKVIELCGIAGVGKSTIFKKMISGWDKSANWIPGHFLYPQEKLKFDTLSKLLLSLERKFTTSEGNVDERALKAYGDRFLAKYPKFIDACWYNIFVEDHTDIYSTDLRFDKAKYLYVTLQKFQLLKESETSKIAVLDEGLVHRIANGLYRQANLEEETEEILKIIQLMPLPEALIYVETDAKEIAARLYKRKKIISSHKSLSLAALESTSWLSMERMNIVIQNLEKRGVPVLHIDAKNEAHENAKVITQFLEEINIREYAS